VKFVVARQHGVAIDAAGSQIAQVQDGPAVTDRLDVVHERCAVAAVREVEAQRIPLQECEAELAPLVAVSALSSSTTGIIVRREPAPGPESLVVR